LDLTDIEAEWAGYSRSLRDWGAGQAKTTTYEKSAES